MPPQLALALCTAFVLVLLRIERAQSKAVSGAAWIPTAWVMAVSSKPLGIWLGVAGNNEAGSAVDRLLLAGLAAGGLAVIMARRRDWQSSLRGNGWLLALLVYMLASTLWSDITLIAVRRWAREAIIVIVALVLMSETSPREALESVLRRTAYVLMPFSLTLIKYFPDLGVIYATWSGQRMWVGVADHKNSLGCLCLVAAFFLTWSLYRRWRDGTLSAPRFSGWADLAVLLLALFLLRGEEGAYSATSVATMGAGVCCLGGLLWLRKIGLMPPLSVLLAATVFLVGFGASAPFLGGSNVAIFSSTLGRDDTLTGRTDTWVELVPVVWDHLFLGFGFGSFWTTARREFYQMSHGHNGYLDTMLELGIVGLGLYTAWLIASARRLHAALAEHYEWASLGVCFLLMAVTYNVAESALNNLANQLTAQVVLIAWVVGAGTQVAPGLSGMRRRPRMPPRSRHAILPAVEGASVQERRRPARPVRGAGNHGRRD